MIEDYMPGINDDEGFVLACGGLDFGIKIRKIL